MTAIFLAEPFAILGYYNKPSFFLTSKKQHQQQKIIFTKILNAQSFYFILQYGTWSPKVNFSAKLVG